MGGCSRQACCKLDHSSHESIGATGVSITIRSARTRRNKKLCGPGPPAETDDLWIGTRRKTDYEHISHYEREAKSRKLTGYISKSVEMRRTEKKTKSKPFTLNVLYPKILFLSLTVLFKYSVYNKHRLMKRRVTQMTYAAKDTDKDSHRMTSEHEWGT